MEKHTLTSLAAFVRSTREGVPLSVTALAERASLSKSEVSAIENGRISLPGADKRRRLAKALGVSHLDLLVAAGEITEEELGDSTGVVERDPDDPREVIAERIRSRNWSPDQLEFLEKVTRDD